MVWGTPLQGCVFVFYFPDGTFARPKGSLPIPGDQARSKEMHSLLALGKQLPTPASHLPSVPLSVFPETGSELQYVCAQVKQLTSYLYIRIVDKGAGQIWGFCKWWVWRVLESFVRSEGYVPSSASTADTKAKILALVESHGWDNSPQGRLCILYLLGKAKSLQKLDWLWRGICTIPFQGP